MPRRIIDPYRSIEIEMSDMKSIQGPALPDWSFVDIERSQTDANAEVVFPEDSKSHKVVWVSKAESVQAMVDEARAEAGRTESTLINNGVSQIPTILEHIGHTIPFVNVIVNSVTLAQEFEEWRESDNAVLKLQRLSRSVSKDSVLKETVEYILAQRIRRRYKQEQQLVGKVTQLAGCAIGVTGPLTHGVTLIPGLAIGGVGSVVRLRVTLASAWNYIKKKYQGQLSRIRTEHARIIFGFAIKYIERKNRVHLEIEHPEFRRAQKMIESLTASLSETSVSESCWIAFRIVEIIEAFPQSEDIDEFLRMGFFKILTGIKT